MKQKLSRREALKTAGALSAATVALGFPAPHVLAATGNHEKLNDALIGCGERARFGHLPYLVGDIFRDSFRACKEGGHPAFSNFADFSGPFVEGLLAGHLAVHAGLHQRVAWDGEAMRSPTHPELGRWIKQERRKGWELL